MKSKFIKVPILTASLILLLIPLLSCTGDRGKLGSHGEDGIQGSPGVKGVQGEKGDTGDTGPQGKQGPTGPTATSTPALITPLPSPIFYMMKNIYEVPVVEWFIYQSALGSTCHYSTSYTLACARHFRTVDLVYFLFYPPSATEHPDDAVYQAKYETSLYSETSGSAKSVAEILGKIHEVSNTLTSWETGGQSALAAMSEEQVGHLRVFHPLFPNSYWNNPTKCQQNPGQSESFCRWRTLAQLAITGGNLSGSFKQMSVSALHAVIPVKQSQGYGYAEILRYALGDDSV